MNNATKEQFKNREGSFSTHGSRRGYSELGYSLTEADFLPLREKRAALVSNKNLIEEIYRSNKTRKNLAALNTINKKLTDVKIEIREHNVSSDGSIEMAFNKGMAFMETAYKILSKEDFRKILHKALDDYNLRDDKHSIK